MSEISKTADQALTVLIEVAERGPLGPAELARSLGMNRTVVHRLLSTLHQRGFVVRQDGGYRAGTLLVRLADRVQPELRVLGGSAMRALSEQIDETIVMHIPDGDDAIVLGQAVAGGRVVRVQHRIGSRHPLGIGASGRVLLAHMDSRAVERVLKRMPQADMIRRQLEGVRQLGYAVSHDELQNGVHGLAVPILDDVGLAVASMAILVPTARSADLLSHVDALIDAAKALSAELGAGLVLAGMRPASAAS